MRKVGVKGRYAPPTFSLLYKEAIIYKESKALSA